MTNDTIAGAAEISAEGIKKHFRSTEPVDALYELVWNGFDAAASEVNISATKGLLGATEEIVVSDDGEGIDSDNTGATFGLFNDSSKKDNITQHGSHGRGRLAFHKIAHRAVWHTRYKGKDASITIDAGDIKKFSVVPAPVGDHVRNPSGTTVLLTHVHQELPERDDLLVDLSKAFGWYLALNPSKRLYLEKESVPIPSHEMHNEVLNISETIFNVTVIRWNDKPTDEKSYVYLLNSHGETVYRELSSLNNKKNFFTSVYISSSWADSFAPAQDLLNPGSNTPSSRTWIELEKQVLAITRGIYDEFLRRHVEQKVAQFVEDGIFPTYAGLPKPEADWRLQNTKELVKHIYIADPAIFNSLNKKQAKILVRLLDRIAVSDENDSLWEILKGVLELDAESANKLAAQLQQTTLENIVNTIEILQRRIATIHALRHVMNEHYADVLETPDLQKIIENNTWLFGPQYEMIGAEEATFTKIALTLRNTVSSIGYIEDSDVEDDATVEGANRQPDLFLARKVMNFDDSGQPVYRCIVVEIKRPGISLNVKHLRQLEDYAAILKKYPEFSSEHIRFELILVGRKISNSDTEIADRMRQMAPNGERGLVMNDGKTKRFVMNWYTLLDGHEMANRALMDSLRLKRDDLTNTSREELVGRLQGIQSLTMEPDAPPANEAVALTD